MLLTACGIPLGRGTTVENAPRGVIVASGQLVGAGGQSASGTADIYNNNGSYIVRLNSVTFVSEAALQVVVSTSTGVVLRTALRATTGSQNYTIGSVVGTFSQVAIHSTRTNQDYAVAILVYTGQDS